MPLNNEATIKVIGVGGGGGNAVNHMCRNGIKDVDFVLCNTDSQALANSPVSNTVQLGSELTKGRGAGNKPDVGCQAAIENIEDVKRAMGNKTEMVFITAGMGGGTGTGAAPVIAKACREMNLLTVGIVTIPFRNEGKRRIQQAIDGILELEQHVDALIVINNEKIREMYGDFKLSEAFAKADNILLTAAKGIAEIITVHGYVNVDLADVKTVMSHSGVAIMGSASASGENRAIKAIEEALNSPLLNNNDIKGARNILLNITSGSGDFEVTMDEIGQILDFVQSHAGFDADLIYGNGIDEKLNTELSVTVVATGFSTSSIPEVLATHGAEREYHTLESQSSDLSNNSKKASSVANPVANTRQNDAFESLYAGVNTPSTAHQSQPKQTSVEFAYNYDFSSEEDIENIENVPAYKRRNINPENKGAQPEKKISRYSLNVGDNNKTFISKNNGFLHDNVD